MQTKIDEIADGIYRISTPVSVVPGGFTFNQYLIVDEQPMLFHTGPPALKRRDARLVGFSHCARWTATWPIGKTRHYEF